jgi:hypothetical protein
MNIIGLMRSALPFSALLLTACLSGGGGGGSSTPTPATTGANSVVYAVTKSAPPVTCPNGGITVQSGIDTNGNGVLDPSEVTSTQYVCNGANGAAGAGITWVNAASSVQAVANTGYLANNAAQVTITLPPAGSLAVGDVIQVSGIGTGGWTIMPNDSRQSIIVDNIPGSAALATNGAISGAQYDAIELQYIGGLQFSVLNFAGNIAAVSALPAGYVYEGGLTWMPVSATAYTQPLAAAFCTGTIINGSTDWRLPTSAELSALYTAYPNNSPLLTSQGWPLGYTWSSTPFSAGVHYNVSLSYGSVGATGDTGINFVTCVR